MTCPYCNTNNTSVAKTCWSCGKELPTQKSVSGGTKTPPMQQQGSSGFNQQGGNRMQYLKYKVIVIEESGLSTLLVGSAKLPIEKIERTLNQQAKTGWQVVFQVIEKRRFLLFWSREAMVVTLGHL